MTNSNKYTKSDLARFSFFDNVVDHPKIKKTISGKNEDMVIMVLENLGYKLDVDFVRQHPVGKRFVLDFAFVNEQVAIEIDGENHNNKKQKKLDKLRDSYLGNNGWIPIRIKDKEFFGYKASFYKSFIDQVVKERREQFDKGILLPIELPQLSSYNEKDYDYEK
jgi:very-short-patch-repair endonuclease